MLYQLIGKILIRQVKPLTQVVSLQLFVIRFVLRDGQIGFED